MASMKVNLSGLIRNAKSACEKGDKTYGAMTAYALEELQEHIEGVVSGKYTIEEFAEHYCITRKEGSECQNQNTQKAS